MFLLCSGDEDVLPGRLSGDTCAFVVGQQVLARSLSLAMKRKVRASSERLRKNARSKTLSCGSAGRTTTRVPPANCTTSINCGPSERQEAVAPGDRGRT